VRKSARCLARSATGLLLALVAGAFFSGCASKPSLPPVPAEQGELQREFDYEIAPGDTVEIFVWRDAELTGNFPVRPDGKITTRLVEDIPASGKTPTELARDIEEAYSAYVKNPVVTVIVNGFVGLPSQQVRVVGEATEPLSVPFSKHMTLLDLMIVAGGLTDFADGNKSVLVRFLGGEQQVYNARLDDLIRGGDISANFALLPGDILIIPEAWF
jgi:polysaccharide export outer membrane protein